VITPVEKSLIPERRVAFDETCALDHCVPGFREGLLQMRVGGRAKISVPPELAWGRKGAGSKIGPNQVIVFDVRLLAVA